jgi:diguanylate cyclase (GGDEF)-like protein
MVFELQQSRETAKDLADKLSSANRELEAKAYKDSLTGLYNHRFFHEMIDKEISSAKRHSKVFSLITFDLDGFKPINDTLGHKFGDNVLKEISNIVNKTLREEDLAFRIGGDEFAILLPETGLEGGVIIAQRLRKAVEKEGDKFKQSSQHAFTISVGVGVYRAADKDDTKEHLMHEVDKALYRSKEEGKNRVTAVC